MPSPKPPLPPGGIDRIIELSRQACERTPEHRPAACAALRQLLDDQQRAGAAPDELARLVAYIATLVD